MKASRQRRHLTRSFLLLCLLGLGNSQDPNVTTTTPSAVPSVIGSPVSPAPSSAQTPPDEPVSPGPSAVNSTTPSPTLPELEPTTAVPSTNPTGAAAPTAAPTPATAPTDAPTVPVPPTAAPAAPTDPPVPATDSPSSVPSGAPVSPTASPTGTPVAPTDAPVVGTDFPSDVPSDIPVAMPTSPPSPNTTETPTATPTQSVAPTTAAPQSPAPTTTTTPEPSSAAPAMPTASPTMSSAPVPLPPGASRVKAELKDITITFTNVGQVDYPAIQQWENLTTQWFGGSFRKGSSSGRWLQTDPTEAGVLDMSTKISFKQQKQESSTNTNTFTYDQTLDYIALEDAEDPKKLATIPFEFPETNAEYGEQLQTTIDAFEDVETPIEVPEVPEQSFPTSAPVGPPTVAPTAGNQPTGGGDEPSGDGGGSGLSTGAIVGIAVGGAAGAAILGLGIYGLMKSGGSDSAGYVSTGSAPPSQLNVPGDDISTLDDPTKIGEGGSSLVYGDQSVATVDYDYSKAYGGGGDTSVVSSAGGTMGDNTRQTSGDVAASSAAARAALGASFDSEGGYREQESNVKEEVIEINAPAGKLGVVIDTPDDGAPVVHAVKDSSVIANQIQVGDKLMAVDDEDVRSMTAIKVSKLISKKSANPSRKLTIVRTSLIEDP